MKRKQWINIRLTLLACVLWLLACAAGAAGRPEFTRVASWEEFVAWYGADAVSEGLRDCLITQSIELKADLELGAGAGRVNISSFDPITVPAGVTLIIDNPELVWMAPMNVKGTLQLLDWSDRSYEATPAGWIVIEQGGALETAEKLTLPQGWITDNTAGSGGTGPDTPDPDSPDPDQPDPSQPGDGPSALFAEVIKVTEDGFLVGRLTIDLVQPTAQEIVIERMDDARQWQPEYRFTWNESFGSFDSYNGEDARTWLSSWNDEEKQKTVLEYWSAVSQTAIALRVTVTLEDGTQHQTQPFELPPPEDPPSEEPYYPPTQDDYDGSGGNRGGVMQGKAERLEKTQPSGRESSGGSGSRGGTGTLESNAAEKLDQSAILNTAQAADESSPTQPSKPALEQKGGVIPEPFTTEGAPPSDAQSGMPSQEPAPDPKQSAGQNPAPQDSNGAGVQQEDREPPQGDPVQQQSVHPAEKTPAGHDRLLLALLCSAAVCAAAVAVVLFRRHYRRKP